MPPPQHNKPASAMDKDDSMLLDPTPVDIAPGDLDPDFSAKLASALALAESTSPNDALEALLNLERTQRLAAAAPETAAVCVAIVKLCHEMLDQGGYTIMMENVQALVKKRAQLKLAVQKMVRQVMVYLEEGSIAKTTDEKEEIIEILRDITAAKIYVELERARLTKTLAKIKEEKGDIDSAADIMQELQVETYGAMDRREKMEFILEQMRLCLDKKDFIRAGIVSKKITARSLTIDTLQDLRLTYYDLMVRIHIEQKKYLEICRCFLSRYQTPKVQETELDEPGGWPYELKLAIIFLFFSPREPLQVDLLTQIAADKNTAKLSPFVPLVKQFNTIEIIRWPLLIDRYKELFQQTLNSHPRCTGVEWEPLLHERVTEHNIYVVSKYYTRIKIDRLAELLALSVQETEDKVSSEVADAKAVWARIDRPNGIITFTKPMDPSDILNRWSGSVEMLLNTVEQTCHLVNKERMRYKFTPN